MRDIRYRLNRIMGLPPREEAVSGRVLSEWLRSQEDIVIIERNSNGLAR
ncbi:hypothetical protein GCM10007108_08660 [Thermogymnomonas acidicola]|uniref:Uncharacterized protein n=1 Tax=Thermogymnomonas acidicola TaxID=399579 RepID=A0AA37F9F7_9ARCH|nr:hypothetical protein GCM10007108_08660 [Thermogymnomonas acidicola]